MRVGVIGAGAIGGTIAALLADAGHEVWVTARGAHAAAIRRTGLVVEGAWGTHRPRVRIARELPAGCEVVFVCTKANDARRALEGSRRALAGACVVIVQNGLHGTAEAARLLPGTGVVGALALFAATIAEPGRIVVTAPGDLWVGVVAGDPSAAQKVAALLGQALPSHAIDDLAACQWTKLMINQVNAMPAITGLSVQETIARPRLRRIIARSMREATRLAFATGVRFGRLQGLGPGILRLVSRGPRAAAGALLLAMARRMGDVPNLGSTLQSIRRGRPSEVDALNGAVVAWAKEHGRAAPVNEALAAMVHEVEASGRFLTADEVARRFTR
ncbi:MAG TPA: 2-dehydropantoate 2-reductase [Microbacteriaceae bacterium]|nr:2-dehydropantoate 2-reductase [Microbacteriaceae bacterium]